MSDNLIIKIDGLIDSVSDLVNTLAPDNAGGPSNHSISFAHGGGGADGNIIPAFFGGKADDFNTATDATKKYNDELDKTDQKHRDIYSSAQTLVGGIKAGFGEITAAYAAVDQVWSLYQSHIDNSITAANDLARAQQALNVQPGQSFILQPTELEAAKQSLDSYQQSLDATFGAAPMKARADSYAVLEAELRKHQDSPLLNLGDAANSLFDKDAVMNTVKSAVLEASDFFSDPKNWIGSSQSVTQNFWNQFFGAQDQAIAAARQSTQGYNSDLLTLDNTLSGLAAGQTDYNSVLSATAQQLKDIEPAAKANLDYYNGLIQGVQDRASQRQRDSSITSAQQAINDATTQYQQDLQLAGDGFSPAGQRLIQNNTLAKDRERINNATQRMGELNQSYDDQDQIKLYQQRRDSDQAGYQNQADAWDKLQTYIQYEVANGAKGEALAAAVNKQAVLLGLSGGNSPAPNNTMQAVISQSIAAADNKNMDQNGYNTYTANIPSYLQRSEQIGNPWVTSGSSGFGYPQGSYSPASGAPGVLSGGGFAGGQQVTVQFYVNGSQSSKNPYALEQLGRDLAADPRFVNAMYDELFR